MRIFADYTDACPKCGCRELSRTDYGMDFADIPDYWETYRCVWCGYRFSDVYRYHHSVGEEEDGE